MPYILYSPDHVEVRPAFRRMNGEVIPEKTFQTGERALYGIKDVPDRIYRNSFPKPGHESLELLEFRTFAEAKAAQLGLQASCGELFQIRVWMDGKLGRNLDPGEPEEPEQTEEADHGKEG